MRIKLFLISFLLLGLSACQMPSSAPENASSEQKVIQNDKNIIQLLSPSGESLSIELALSSESRRKGLMYREHMNERAGMAFLFENERQLSFWMKNTLIPLDILFINTSGKVVDIQTMIPCPPEQYRCPSYLSAEKALYAIELNKGAAEKFGFVVGMDIDVQVFLK